MFTKVSTNTALMKLERKGIKMSINMFFFFKKKKDDQNYINVYAEYEIQQMEK